MPAKNYLKFFLILLVCPLWSQETLVDLPQDLSYNEFKKQFDHYSSDSIKKKVLTQFLQKAKREEDTLNMAHAYNLLNRMYDNHRALKYVDSLILLTKDYNDREYPAYGFLLKGSIHYDIGVYKEALNYYLIALKHAKRVNNEYFISTINFNIGLIKNLFGQREEAGQEFRKSMALIKNNSYNEQFIKSYNRTLYALADHFTYTQQLDSAKILTQEGIIKSLKEKNMVYYPSFLLNSGLNHYHSKNYLVAIDSLQKAKSLLMVHGNDKIRSALCDFYIGKSLHSLGDKTSINHFKAVDVVLGETMDILPELLSTYKYLIADAAQKNELSSQLVYINKLMKYDSIVDDNYKQISIDLKKEYEIPLLLEEKEILLQSLYEKNKVYTNRIILLVIICFVLLYYTRQSYVNAQRFKALMSKKTIDENVLLKKENDFSKAVAAKQIPSEILEHVLCELDDFEASNRFLDRHYTLTTLAKELNTNSTYLSRIINIKKEMSFSEYIKNLRINYAVKEIKESNRFDKYTIEGIAQACGFKSANSFSKAFYRETGLQTRYFLKQIKKERQ